ncbi:hypothetical protein CEXT_357601 [Caerostris extrusa]|uniref:Uncharacterized protein n=1 Tax=Caerostris extrusa TaxID=172846 RepID=A0AAV4NRN1_CAEEX|nr:hypothetical protein CEXT_357601 [Caerostris extrusa]
MYFRPKTETASLFGWWPNPRIRCNHVEEEAVFNLERSLFTSLSKPLWVCKNFSLKEIERFYLISSKKRIFNMEYKNIDYFIASPDGIDYETVFCATETSFVECQRRLQLCKLLNGC